MAYENSSGRNLRTKTPQAEASGKCASIFLPLPLPSPSIKAGWAYRSKLLRDNISSLLGTKFQLCAILLLNADIYDTFGGV